MADALPTTVEDAVRRCAEKLELEGQLVRCEVAITPAGHRYHRARVKLAGRAVVLKWKRKS